MTHLLNRSILNEIHLIIDCDFWFPPHIDPVSRNRRNHADTHRAHSCSPSMFSKYHTQSPASYTTAAAACLTPTQRRSFANAFGIWAMTCWSAGSHSNWWTLHEPCTKATVVIWSSSWWTWPRVMSILCCWLVGDGSFQVFNFVIIAPIV